MLRYRSTSIPDATRGAPLSLKRNPAGTPGRGYYRFPATDGHNLVFTAEGDLWRVSLAGGAAQRLTTHHGVEKHAAISPNGRLVAFSASYEGTDEIYMMPLGGGRPLRLTYDAERGAAVIGWTHDGRVIYRTRYYSTLPGPRLVLLDPKTRRTELVPLADANDVTFAKDGAIFFTRYPFQGSHTKRYKGGTAQSLWRFKGGAAEATPLTSSYEGTSKAPMFISGRVYFVSDRDGTMNIWSMTPSGRDLKQHTWHKHFDIKGASSGGGKIVYQLGADLHVYDVGSGKERLLQISLVSDFDQERLKWIRKPMRYVTAAHLSPKGERLVVTSRGVVFVIPRKGGRRVRVTRQAGVRFREARFGRDGETILALSDQSGEVELWQLASDGIGNPRRLTKGANLLYRHQTPSPTGMHVAYTDKNNGLWIFDRKSGKQTRIRVGKNGEAGDLRWSPDGRFLAFVDSGKNLNDVIYIYDTTKGETVAATSSRVESYSPAWGREGKWLYFLSDRHLVNVVPGTWGPRQPDPIVARPTQIYALALRPGYSSPFKRPNELTVKEKKEKKGKKGKKTQPIKVRIELKGLRGRLWPLPVRPGRYRDLQVTQKHLYYVEWARSPSRKRKGGTLIALPITFKKVTRKAQIIAKNLKSYEISRDGKSLLVQTKKAFYVFPATGKKEKKKGDKKIDFRGWTFSIEPAAEWRQMLRDAWRLERDYFYDRKLHGADWPTILKRHLGLVGRVRDRDELADLIAQMVGELQALHTFVGGGDLRRGRTYVVPASLGVKWARMERGYRIERIYRGDADYPKEQSPLLRPGVGGRVGDIVTHVDGVSTLSVADARMLLRGKARRQVRLRLLRKGIAREVIVKPLSPRKFDFLRYSDWELSRRERVEKSGGNKIGYVHLRAMTARDYTSWARNFYPVFHKQGLIVDVRNNRGGNIDSWILGKLLRRAWFYWQGRAGQPVWNMQYAFRGHLVVLTNAFTMSDGEAFAEGFRRLKLGKIIGTRTWGGEIWLSFSNRLVDGGIASAAELGVYGPKRRWLIEGRGVLPDRVVDNLPHATFMGKDQQLDAAIAHLLALIKARPVGVPKPPPYPSKAGDPRKALGARKE